MRNTDGLRQRLPRIVADEPVASACDGLVRRVYRADARGAEDIDGVRTRLSDLAVPVIEGTASLERPQRPPVRLRLLLLRSSISSTRSPPCGPNGCQKPIWNCE